MKIKAKKIDDSAQMDAGFRNKKATSVIKILKGIPGMTDTKARALLMYHGGLTALNKVETSEQLLRFKALRDLFTEMQAQIIIQHLQDRKKKRKPKYDGKKVIVG